MLPSSAAASLKTGTTISIVWTFAFMSPHCARRLSPDSAGAVRFLCHRQLNAEHGAVRRARTDAAAVRLRDGRDDRQAETDPAARSRARRIGAVEALEDALKLFVREPWAGVLNLDHGVAVLAPDADVRRRVGGCVRAHVGEEVVDDLAETHAVADDERRGGVEIDRPLGIDGARGVHRLTDELVQPDPLQVERPAFVEAGEQQEILD